MTTMTTSEVVSTPKDGTTPKAAVPHADPLGDAWVMTGRAVRQTLRNPVLIASATFLPLILMLLMTASFGSIVDPEGDHGSYINFALPVYAVMGIIFAGLGTGAAAFAELQEGFDRRLRAMPISRSAPLVGRIAGDAVRNLLTLVVVVLVGFALGFRFRTGPLEALAFFVLPLAFGTAVAWVMVAMAVRASSGESVAAMLNTVLLVASFLSTGFVPLEDLPGWAQPIASANPVSAVVESMRALSQGGELADPLLRSAGWTVGLTVVFGTLAVRGYRRHASG